MVVKIRLCGVLLAAIILSSSTFTSVSCIELHKMNLHKAISNNLKDAPNEIENNEDGEADMADEKSATNIDNNDVIAYQAGMEVKMAASNGTAGTGTS